MSFENQPSKDFWAESEEYITDFSQSAQNNLNKMRDDIKAYINNEIPITKEQKREIIMELKQFAIIYNMRVKFMINQLEDYNNFVS